jgi:DnaJ-domain-containing protein 1
MRLATAYRLVGDDLRSKLNVRRAEIQQRLTALDAELRQLIFEQTMQRIAACGDGDEAMRIAKEALASLPERQLDEPGTGDEMTAASADASLTPIEINQESDNA